MKFGRFQSVGGKLADAAMRQARGKASSMTDQAVRAAVDQGVRVLEIATEQVRSRDSAILPIELGVTLSMGLLELHMKAIVPAPDPTEAPPGGPALEKPSGSAISVSIMPGDFSS